MITTWREKRITERIDRLLFTSLVVAGTMALMSTGRLQESAGVGLLGLVIGHYYGMKGKPSNDVDTDERIKR